MANRHKMYRKGGRVAYTGGGSNVAKEAEAGSHAAEEAVERKHGGKVPGHKAKRRYARGGGVGSDKHPFSSAHRG